MDKVIYFGCFVASAHISASSSHSEIRVTTLVLLVLGCVSGHYHGAPLPVVGTFTRLRLRRFNIDQTTPGTTMRAGEMQLCLQVAI